MWLVSSGAWMCSYIYASAVYITYEGLHSAFVARLIPVLGTCPPIAQNNLPIFGTFICS